jgi:3-methylcrotonyl-CoA carboxylase alpha subunit
MQGERGILTIPIPEYAREGGDAGGEGSVRTPMPCKISQVMVQAGQKVTKGQVLVILEAMKMEVCLCYVCH